MNKLSFIIVLFICGVSLGSSCGSEAKGGAPSCEPNTVSYTEITDSNTGPTILLGYNENSKSNPIFSFMYFVPMISPTMVEMEISPNCLQKGRFVSHKIEYDGDKFEVISEFEINGTGHYKNCFDPEEIIKWNIKHRNEGDRLTKILDYIKFEGQAFGRLEISGTITDGIKEVKQVKAYFNNKDTKSPVTIGIYDIYAKDGEFKYTIATNRTVVRVNALTFQKSQGEPKMDIEIASLSQDEDCDSLWATLKGKIANFFLNPLEINSEGNQSMLEFGLALTEKKESFTFTKAKNLKQNEATRQQFALKSSDSSEI